jgi:hypothetical protein
MKDLMLQNKKRNRRGMDINAHPSKADETSKTSRISWMNNVKQASRLLK